MKEKVYKITRDEEQPYVSTQIDIETTIEEEMNDFPVGSKITIEAIEMTEEEINALPEL